MPREKSILPNCRNGWPARIEKRVGSCLHFLAELLASVAIERLRRRHGDPEKVGADIRVRVRHVRIRRVRRDDDAREEDVRLDAFVQEIEVEVVDAAERDDRILQAGVVMDAAEEERARRNRSLL